MTRNQIRRPHNDPKWSGRYVQGADNGWEYDECTTEHLLVHLMTAASWVKAIPRGAESFPVEWDGHGVLETRYAKDLAMVFELVDNLQRYLPWVEGQCVMARFHDTDPWDVVSAHTTLADAMRWAAAWVTLPIDRQYDIQFLPAPILMFRHPDADPFTFIRREHADEF